MIGQSKVRGFACKKEGMHVHQAFAASAYKKKQLLQLLTRQYQQGGPIPKGQRANPSQQQSWRVGTLRRSETDGRCKAVSTCSSIHASLPEATLRVCFGGQQARQNEADVSQPQISFQLPVGWRPLSHRNRTGTDANIIGTYCMTHFA